MIKNKKYKKYKILKENKNIYKMNQKKAKKDVMIKIDIFKNFIIKKTIYKTNQNKMMILKNNTLEQLKI